MILGKCKVASDACFITYIFRSNERKVKMQLRIPFLARSSERSTRMFTEILSTKFGRNQSKVNVLSLQPLIPSKLFHTMLLLNINI